MTYRPQPLPGHKVETCQCVRCRLCRGERPNPQVVQKTSKARNYLWINDALDEEVTNYAVLQNRSKASIVREAIIAWVNAQKERE